MKNHVIQGRKVEFDLKQRPVHWLPDDPFSSHFINGVHLLLPAGEFWFCRVFNKCVKHISDPTLASDVKGFIRQEGIHGRVHVGGQEYLTGNGYAIDRYLRKVHLLFEKILGDTPFGLKSLKGTFAERPWLKLRVGIIATVEHFTGVLGHWALNNPVWKNGDPVIKDLFLWHLAEEVEHRCVAYDLYQHICTTRTGFYTGRALLMLLVFPLFIYYLTEGFRHLARQDRNQEMQRKSKQSTLRLSFHLNHVSRETGNLPSFNFMLASTMRWFAPGYHPINEGDTQQALDYLARSPAALAAAGNGAHH